MLEESLQTTHCYCNDASFKQLNRLHTPEITQDRLITKNDIEYSRGGEKYNFGFSRRLLGQKKTHTLSDLNQYDVVGGEKKYSTRLFDFHIFKISKRMCKHTQSTCPVPIRAETR